MGLQFDWKILGMQALMKKCQPKTITVPVNEGIAKLAVWTQRTVMVSTPVDTGRLRSSVTSQVYGDITKIGTNVQYAQFVEYGTKYMKPRHVTEGSAARILGIGMFQYTMQLLQAKVEEFVAEIGKAIEVRFG